MRLGQRITEVILLPLLLAGLSIRALLAYLESIGLLKPYSESELTMNLGKTLAEAQREFQRRIEHRFPIGISELALVNELSRQGFTVTQRDKGGAAKYEPRSREFFGRRFFVVSWKSDAHGLVQDLKAIYAPITL